MAVSSVPERTSTAPRPKRDPVMGDDNVMFSPSGAVTPLIGFNRATIPIMVGSFVNDAT